MTAQPKCFYIFILHTKQVEMGEIVSFSSLYFTLVQQYHAECCRPGTVYLICGMDYGGKCLLNKIIHFLFLFSLI